ncbi:hypothetical protein NXY56_000012 [Leishmania guyanensis]|uniref:Uncharacterized protein n=1 Tax=Leishmania guyanensis TaxID=5670 RepID=A0A1E1IN53_LEIGU|nr:hypothetical protein, conserved [Leishmania guyanensis]
MHFAPAPSSLHQRPDQDNHHPQRHNVVDGADPYRTATLLPLRRRGSARDISAMLTAPVVEYRPPQWATPLGISLWTMPPASNPMATTSVLNRSSGADSSGAPHAYYTTSPKSAAASTRRGYEDVGGRVRGRRAGGATATGGRQSFGTSPSPHSTTSTRQAHRSRSIAEVRPGYVTSTERARYRNSVTKRLIDLYDEVAELHGCRGNMKRQVTKAMRTDPRSCRERNGEVQLANKPTPQQQRAVESVKDAFEVLYDAMHELIAAYLTPEEKRYLGIDTHLFQTNREKAKTYQYAPPQPKQRSSSTGAARGARRKTAATKSPLPSIQHSELREEEEEAVAEGEEEVHTAAIAPTSGSTAAPMPADPVLTPPIGTPALGASAAFNSAQISFSAPPIQLAQQSMTENSLLAAQPQPVTSSPPPLYSSILPAEAPGDDFGAAAEQQSVMGSHTDETEIPVRSPERVFAPATSMSTLNEAWPSDTAEGSPVPSPTKPKPPAANDELVKAPVGDPDEAIPTPKMPPTPAPQTPLSQPPSRTASTMSINGAPATKASAPHAPATRSGLKRFVIDSDSNSDM